MVDAPDWPWLLDVDPGLPCWLLLFDPNWLLDVDPGRTWPLVEDGWTWLLLVVDPGRAWTIGAWLLLEVDPGRTPPWLLLLAVDPADPLLSRPWNPRSWSTACCCSCCCCCVCFSCCCCWWLVKRETCCCCCCCCCCVADVVLRKAICV